MAGEIDLFRTVNQVIRRGLSAFVRRGRNVCFGPWFRRDLRLLVIGGS
jgi:hypothetical protein